MTANASRLTIDTQTATRQLTVVGVIDSHTADDLDGALRTVGTDADVELDLSGIEFVDSSGIRVIVRAHQDLHEAGHRLLLSNISPSVRRLLEITGLDQHLDLV